MGPWYQWTTDEVGQYLHSPEDQLLHRTMDPIAPSENRSLRHEYIIQFRHFDIRKMDNKFNENKEI
jgi:hypothetical protein